MVHDPQLITLNFNPETFPSARINLAPKSGLKLYYIKAVSHVNLKTPTNPCKESEDFSSKACVKNSINRKVGCCLPWDKWSDPSLPKCTKVQELERIDDEFQKALYNSKEIFSSSTGCNFPCRYIEYQLVGEPVPFDPKLQGIALLLTNLRITEKRETVLYPFESFLAEFGGALGLFVGFSFFGFFGLIKSGTLMMILWFNKNK